jgi:hypothetical protein
LKLIWKTCPQCPVPVPCLFILFSDRGSRVSPFLSHLCREYSPIEELPKISCEVKHLRRVAKMLVQASVLCVAGFCMWLHARMRVEKMLPEGLKEVLLHHHCVILCSIFYYMYLYMYCYFPAHSTCAQDTFQERSKSVSHLVNPGASSSSHAKQS